jgi:hypothetical protein
LTRFQKIIDVFAVRQNWVIYRYRSNEFAMVTEYEPAMLHCITTDRMSLSGNSEQSVVRSEVHQEVVMKFKLAQILKLFFAKRGT